MGKIGTALIVAAGLVAGCSGSSDFGHPDGSAPGGGGGDGGGDPNGPPDLAPVEGPRFATGLRIDEIAAFQAVKISLVKGGVVTSSRNAPVVAGRDALLRVYVTPDASFTARAITAELRLDGAVQRDTRTIGAASTEAQLDSTFHFTIAAADLKSTSSFSVTLIDPGAAPSNAASSPARHPADGTSMPLGALASGKLRVLFVPMRYDFDGSHRLPDTSTAQLDRYRLALLEAYPLTAVELTVRAAVPWATALDFDALNDALVTVRENDQAPVDLYYYGLISPAASFNAYCKSSCVTGQTFVVTKASDASVRVGAGVGFTGADSASTLVHELGHAHGREHAPCGVSDADPKYPYAGGVTGVWGYSIVDHLLRPPTRDDFMSYCSPEWVSDYTYRALFDRVAAVAKLPGSTSSAYPYRFVHIDADGGLRLGATVRLREPPHGTPRPVHLLDESGGEQAQLTGSYYPNADRPGGTLIIPDEGPRFPLIELAGHRLRIQ